MSRTRWLGAAAAGAILLLAAYLGSPLLAANALRAAAQTGNADKLQRLVDFPAVRESLKGQLNALIIESMQSDPELRNNPFAGFAAALVPAIVNQAVDGYVTPDGLARMMAAKPPQSDGPRTDPAIPGSDSSAGAGTAPSIQHSYRDLDTYAITSVNPADPQARFSFILHRQGLLGWKLARIELPKSLMQKTAAGSRPKEAPAPVDVDSLLQRWAAENEACRGGSGDLPETDRACADRNVTDAELERAGWCYGENAAYGYQSEWRPCGSPKFASEADAEQAAQADAAAHGR